MKYLAVLLLIIALASCSSFKDRVIQRMDDLDEKPIWAMLAKTTYTKDGKFYAIGFTESDASSKISALSRIADNNARVELAKIVDNSINAVFQNVQEGVGISGELARSVASESSRVVAQQIIPERRYWEKVLIKDAEGEKAIKLHLYSLLYIPESKLKKLIKRAMRKRKGISKELMNKVDKQLDHLLENK